MQHPRAVTAALSLQPTSTTAIQDLLPCSLDANYTIPANSNDIKKGTGNLKDDRDPVPGEDDAREITEAEEEDWSTSPAAGLRRTPR